MVKNNLGPASSREPHPEDLVGHVEPDEFVDSWRDRRVLTSTSDQDDILDHVQGEDLPKGWFSWRK